MEGSFEMYVKKTELIRKQSEAVVDLISSSAARQMKKLFSVVIVFLISILLKFFGYGTSLSIPINKPKTLEETHIETQ